MSAFVCLFDLILYVPNQQFSVMSGQVFLVEPVLHKLLLDSVYTVCIQVKINQLLKKKIAAETSAEDNFKKPQNNGREFFRAIRIDYCFLLLLSLLHLGGPKLYEICLF